MALAWWARASGLATLAAVFRERRCFAVPELDVFHHSVEARAPGLRLSWHLARRVASDYALLERALPFAHRMTRSCLTVLLGGQGRFEERGSRIWLDERDLVMSDQRQRGTEAYAGATTSILVVEWDPRRMGVPITGAFERLRLSKRDHRRLGLLARALDGSDPAGATIEILEVLRSFGLQFERADQEDLADRTSESDRRLSAAIGEQLSRLESYPAIDDLVGELGWTSRHVNRRFAALAQAYGLPWLHWRGALHQARMLAALRLLSVPGATTELVARHAGLRAPSALCHAFAKGGLPSPGALASAARTEVLERWTAFVPARTELHVE